MAANPITAAQRGLYRNSIGRLLDGLLSKQSRKAPCIESIASIVVGKGIIKIWLSFFIESLDRFMAHALMIESDYEKVRSWHRGQVLRAGISFPAHQH
jgi:hypothetical protein